MASNKFLIGQTEVQFYKHYPFYFLLEDDAKKIIVSTETPEGMVDLVVQCAFDYKRYKNKEWSVYIDISFSAAGYFDAYLRSCFFLKRDLELFIPETIEPMMEQALEQTGETILAKCKENNLAFGDNFVPFNETLRRNFTNEIIDIFNRQRLEQEREEKETRVEEGLTIPADSVGLIVLTGTIVIIDKVMFDNEAFDWKNNSEVFAEAVPISSYLTMREECIALKDKPILLNWYSTTYLVICIDCALQLLLGPKSEKLEKAVANQGFNSETTKQYISDSSKILANLKPGFKRDGIDIPNLEKGYDWNSLLK
jgi:hypothetical protein